MVLLTKAVRPIPKVIPFFFARALERGAWGGGAGGVWVAVMGSRQTVVGYYGNKKYRTYR